VEAVIPFDVTPSLSVIIPMYQEARRIGPTLEDVLSTLDQRGLESEVILVDDGSTDDTLRVVREIAAAVPDGPVEVRILEHVQNRGKGAAVRTGLGAAAAPWRLMMDADNSSRVAEVDLLLAACGPGVGLVAGSREAAGAKVRAKPSRKLTGALFRGVLSTLGMNLLQDTQCGFKLYRADVGCLVARHAKEDGFAFDLEHLLLVRAAGLETAEVGIHWEHRDGGTIRPIKDGLKMIAQAARIRQRWLGRARRLGTLPAVQAGEVLGWAGPMIELKPELAALSR
jgi:dolichyl-phosphate beta-glucosyltransferase